MKYKLIVRAYTENDKYEEQYAEYEKQNRESMYGGRNIKTEPEKFVYDKVLDTALTEEQFKAVQKAVIETF